METPESTLSTVAAVLTPEQLLEHWQGHRRVTRRTIEAFPDDQIFEFSIGGMRTFGEMALEILTMATPMVKGLATGEWEAMADREARPKEEVLRLWDEATAQINEIWPTIPAARFQEKMKAFGQWEVTGFEGVLYAIDNEIHHRAQGIVYLRALGIEPPLFYDRS